MKTASLLRKTQKGQSLMELAVVVVILMIILTGVMELGRVMIYYIAMRDAVQEGAIYASINPAACDLIVMRVQKNLNDTDPSSVLVDVRINGSACAGASNTCANLANPNEVRVTVNQPDYPISIPFMGTLLGRQTISLSASTTSTIIRPPCP